MSVHPVTHGLTRNLKTPRTRHRAMLLFFWSVLLLCCRRKGALQKDAHKKGTLFDLLPTDIFNGNKIWIVGIEHSIKLKAIVTQTNIPHNPVLRMLTYMDWDHFLKFGNLSFYHTIRYEWTYRHYIKIPCGRGPTTHFVKNKHIWMN